MEADRVSLDRTTWVRFTRAVRQFARCEVRGRAALFAGSLLLLMFGINGLNVVNSYVGRDFMTAIERRSSSAFFAMALLYASVFAASTLVAVLLRFCEERLALIWREWLTGRLVTAYLSGGVYYHMKEPGGVDNPDQRIADDVRGFTATTISFVLMLLNAVFTIVAFSGVMWSISSLLFGVAVVYAIAGSLLTVALGRPLMGLNYAQFDRDAALRAALVHVRENAESVALTHSEGTLRARALGRLGSLVDNLKRIIAVNRNVSFFTTGYGYAIQLIPALIVGPLFIRGDVEFGVIPQSAMAFSHLLGAFSLVVTQFGSISSYAAVMARLSALAEAADPATFTTHSGIETTVDPDRLAYEGLTLRAAGDDRVLLADFSATVEPGSRLLVTGPNSAAQVALFRATAGLWRAGKGRIVRPPPEGIAFLPERPYLPPGPLGATLLPQADGVRSHERVELVLRELGLSDVVARAGGLDREADWDDLLSLGEQQLLSVGRILLARPRFAMLHEIGTTLDHAEVTRVIALLSRASITSVLLAEAGPPHGVPFDAALELEPEGGWRWLASSGEQKASRR